ncbi:MAG: tRNA (adenosine(37)-N6)-threonylcarbamoyltransferase complex transferase subunit TsaD [Opitutales bacterium]|nr:tRNA (adenosine(37)-N6)-threonylcarbamoyltransferase complex transferase subunit TsaD [Opitutales bacterium]
MILGIESSCDESALAVFDPTFGIRWEKVSTQIDLHAVYGGVVPDLASREHLAAFELLMEECRNQDAFKHIGRIAVTCGPGLASCLAIGLALAQAIANATAKPLCGVNHLMGHAFSPFIPLHRSSPAQFEADFKRLLPHLGLIVSGGNTMLIEVATDRSIRVIASTVDDAAGEALDKGAKLLGLGYPGGPRIEELAHHSTQPFAHPFPVSFPNPEDLKFSFAGLKTSLRYMLEKLSDDALQSNLASICFSYQQAVVDQLIRKTRQVLQSGRYRSIGLSGGVANNTPLREAFVHTGRKSGVPALVADKHHTGDNASMIAFAAWIQPPGLLPHTADSPLGFHPSMRL